MAEEERVLQVREEVLEWMRTIEFPEEGVDPDDWEGPKIEQILAGLLLQLADLLIRVEALEGERKD